MENKIKCPHCAHLFSLKDAEVAQTKDEGANFRTNIKPKEFIICPACNAWLDKSYFKI